MATVTYKCNICDRDIDLLENSNGLTTFSKCVITYGCKGKLLKTKRNPDNIREKFPSEVPGLEDYSQRRVLFNYTQTLPNNVWVIDHDLGTNPATTIYINDAAGKLSKLDPDQYEILFVNKNQIRVTFDNFYNGKAQLVSRSSIKLTPQMVGNDVALFQVTAEGYFTFAVPKYLTKFQYPPSLLPTPSLPYKLDDTPIRIEVSIKKPNEEEELCTEFLSNSLTEVPWAGWNEVLVRRRRNYYLFSKSILDFRTLGGDTLKFSDIPTGTQLKITRIDYGTGVLQPIPPEGLYIMLATTPFTSNDKVKDKVIDVANMVDNDIDYFSYNSTDFFVDPTNVEKTYPDVLMVKPVNFIPPAPSVTPTISPTHSLTPSMSPTSTVIVSATPLVTPTPTPTVTRSLTLTPSPTPSITPSSTPGSFNQPFDYALVRYTWTPNDGTDLDTRTAIIDPPRNVDVGWSRSNTDGIYLTWGGDNTSPSGPEAVIIDFNQLAEDYQQEDFTIRLRLNWYGQRVSGNVGVQFQSFLGGTMQQSGTDFINVGGLLVNDAVVYVNCASNTAGNVDGSDIGTLVYDSTNKTAQFFPLVPAVTSTPTPTATPTISVTPSVTATISVTPSITQTISLTPTLTSTISVTPTSTPPISTGFAANVLALNPVAYYRLNETSGTVASDSSGNGNNGLYTAPYTLNQTSLLPNGEGRSMAKTSTGNMSFFSDVSQLDKPFTILSWVQFSSSTGLPQVMVGLGNPNGAQLARSANGKIVGGATSIFNLTEGNAVLALNTPYMVAWTMDTDGSYAYYINGVSDLNDTTTSSFGTTGVNSYVGIYPDGTGYPMIGNIQDVAIFDKSLTPTDIANLYASALPPSPTPTISTTPSLTQTISVTPTITVSTTLSPTPTTSMTPSSAIVTNYSDAVLADGPIGYWKTDETSGTVMVDSSGNGNNGVYANNPSALQLGAAPLRDGSAGSMNVLTVTAGLAYCPTITSVASSFTLECIVNITGGASHKILFGGEWGGAGDGTALWYDGSTLKGRLVTDDVSSPNNKFGTTVHVAFTYDAVAQVASLYENGVLSASINSTSVPRFNGRLNIMGRASFNDIPVGFGSDFAYYDKALPAGRILVHANLVQPVVTPTPTPTISVTPTISLTPTITVQATPSPTLTPSVTPNNSGPLLHFDGANDSTVITDSHGVSTWTPNGLAKISTAQSKFGGSSLAVNSGYVTTTDMGHSFLGDFCVEGWAFATATPRGIFHTNPDSTASGLALGWDDDHSQWALYYTASATNSATTTIPTGWFHYAVYRVGDTLRLAINGVNAITVTSPSDDALGAYQTMYLGIYYNSGYPWVGYLDEFRVTFGSSPYQTASFTPPTASFA
jgi:hypothetical protein